MDDDDFDDYETDEDGMADYDGMGDDLDFADPGGRSALRAATVDNPRNQPCPQCKEENVLTPKDVALHYVCDCCADSAEGFGP